MCFVSSTAHMGEEIAQSFFPSYGTFNLLDMAAITLGSVIYMLFIRSSNGSQSLRDNNAPPMP